jgi:hypothetical protein
MEIPTLASLSRNDGFREIVIARLDSPEEYPAIAIALQISALTA